jgi:hypothetical protein
VAGWLVGAYAVITLLLIASAGRITLSAVDAERRKDAFKVLRLLVTAGAFSGGLIELLLRLHELLK